MKTRLAENPSIVLNMSDKPDHPGPCLIKMPVAELYWLQALRDPDFDNGVISLCLLPYLENAAIRIQALLEADAISSRSRLTAMRSFNADVPPGRTIH